MNAPAIALAFFDPDREIYGTARAGTTLIFEGSSHTALPDVAEIEVHDGGYRARLDGRLDLAFTPTSEPTRSGGASTRACQVSGTVGGREIDGVGTATETHAPPPWEELDAVRSISALFGPERAVLALARRPRGARGHGEELVSAHLVVEGRDSGVEDARLSTVYDGEGRQRSASLEMWLPAQDFPRRLAGTVRAGVSLALDGLRVNAAVFAWTMEGHEGIGAYDVTVRDEPAAA